MSGSERKQKFILAEEALGYCREEDRKHRPEDFELTRYHRENVTLPSDIVDDYDGKRDECYWCGYAIPRRHFEDAESVLRNKDRNFSLRELQTENDQEELKP
jgi:hypothetical protein